jgi:3-hydroxybutyryl-CoA dehydrogenase
MVDKLLAKDVAKQRISQEDATAARERLIAGTSLDDLSDVDFVIEAVPVR